MGELPEFRPFPLFEGCHAQTIAGSFLTFYRNPSSLTRFVHLSDGEKITLEVTTPPKWQSSEPTVVMVHGLCGSHRSPCLVRLANKLYKKGIRSIRINLRGCGSAKGHSKRMYHAEMSDDVWQALKEIKRDTPNSPLLLLGFSLGGNIVLKLGGERRAEAGHLVEKIIAINPPVDLYTSVHLINKNRIYETYFMNYLRDDVHFRHRHFEDLPPIKLSLRMNLLEFNEFYISPQSGFSSVIDYYQASSSGPLLPNITVPCHILFSKDDPIVNYQVLQNVPIPPNINIFITEFGGHIGYLGIPGQEGGFHWIDSLLLKWLS